MSRPERYSTILAQARVSERNTCANGTVLSSKTMSTSPLRFGLCTFSCHRHWEAVRTKQPGTQFTESVSFLDYVHQLGAAGVQTRVQNDEVARQMRERCDALGAYYEGDVRLPKKAEDVPAFESDVQLAKAAGASVARAVLMGGRRYEVFKSLTEFRDYQAGCRRTLQLVEPVLRKHGLKLAIENHKDQQVNELLPMLRKLGSEWVGVCVDTGNNIALLEDPHAVVEALAPVAFSVHLKDMAVQPAPDGFLLSEVPLGTGFLDLPKIIKTLHAANPSIVFNIEMGTRDPLRVPCLTQTYWATFPQRPASELAKALAGVHDHPPKADPPNITGKPMAQQIADEEANNRQCIEWMKAAQA